MKRILIVDDEISICNVLSKFLERNSYQTTIAASGKEALKILKRENFDLILCDYNLGDLSGKHILEAVQEINPATLFIFISGYGSIPTAVNLVKEGAYQFLTKPLYPDLILKTIEDAFLEKKVIARPQEEKNYFSDYIKGESPAAKKLFEYVDLVAPTDYTVIIHGETGTGKEALAHFLHEGSKRSKRPFIAIDCGSLSKELAASELFGYAKGAFTGAGQDKKGAFELGDGGTIFLDEIGNLSPEVQMYLLRVLQERIVRRVGDMKEITVDVRVIVASNEALLDLVKEKRFREDLYHRLNEFTLEVPALRERKEDLPLFVDAFVRQAASQLGKKMPGLSKTAWLLFRTYQWPGNIRELQNIIKRSCLLSPDGSLIEMDCLPLELLESNAETQEPQSAEAGKTSRESNPGLKEVALNAEREKILKVLEAVNYNKTQAAVILEIDRKTLYNKLKEIQNLKSAFY